jgi:hypothetical protein
LTSKSWRLRARQQLGQLTHGQAAEVRAQVGPESLLAAELAGVKGSVGIGNHLPLLGLAGSVGAVGAAGASGLAALAALLGVLVAAVGAVGRPMIPKARLLGLRARLSLLSSTTTLAPKVAYSSSRRTHWCSSASGRGRAGAHSG